MIRNTLAVRRTRLWLQRLEGRDLPTFVAAPTYPVGGTVRASVIADFNGDGAGDIAVAHTQSGGKVSVLIANGNDFEPPVIYPATGSTSDVIAADFSGDGIVDLAAVGSTSAPNLAFFRGIGDGTFEPAQFYNASVVGSTDLVAADFNNDGALDIATVTTAATVTIALNQGGGAFADPQQGYVATTHLHDLQAGDLNGDGNADVLAVGYYCDPPPFVKCFPKNHVFLGDGNGGLTLGPTYVDTNPFSVVLGDFDLDQDLDYATVGGIAVHVWLGNGDGTFAFSNAYTVPGFYWDLAAGDIDGDGKLDLVVGNYDAKTITVLRGMGDGLFQIGLGYALTNYPSSITTGDLNGDLDVDVVATIALGNTSDITVLQNVGAGNLKGAAIYPLSKYPRSVTNADFNGDGRVDLAVAGNGVSVFNGRGDGTFDPSVRYSLGTSAVAIAVGDFNRDGHRDLVTADIANDQVSILRNKGDGTFFPAMKFAAGYEPTGLVVADFTGEGFQDLVVINHHNVINPGTISFLRGTGTGRFRAPVTYPAAYFPSAITHGDFDGDGKLDVAVAAIDNDVTYDKAVLIIRGNGNGSFQAPLTHLVPTTYQLSSILTRDFNGDGKLDLAVTGEYPSSTQTPSVFILLGNGDSTFQPAAGYVVRNNCSSLAAADFDGNGTLDLVVGVGNTFSHTLALMRGNGDGTFTEPTLSPVDDYYTVGPYVQGLSTADFNSDGAPDVAAVLGAYSGFPGVSIVLNANERSGDGGEDERPSLTPTELRAGDLIASAHSLPSDAMPAQSHAAFVTATESNPPLSLSGIRPSRLGAIKRLVELDWTRLFVDP